MNQLFDGRPLIGRSKQGVTVGRTLAPLFIFIKIIYLLFKNCCPIFVCIAVVGFKHKHDSFANPYNCFVVVKTIRFEVGL